MPTGSPRATRLALIVAVLLWAAPAVLAAPPDHGPAPLLLVVSIDGLRPDHVLDAEAHGAKVPQLRRFLREGAFADGVIGVIPTVTYPSHTTLVTGVAPARHGIVANTTFDPLRQNQDGWYWYAEDIRVPTLWDVARRAGLTTASIQWPVTVGARVTWNIPEFWRTGSDDDAKLLRAVATPGLLAELEAQLGPYPRTLDVAADDARGRYAARLLETKRPSLLTLHLLALDHVQHDTAPFSAATLAVLERLDAVLGTLRAAAERLAPGRVWLAVVSDHGFAASDAQLNLFPAFHAVGLFDVGAGGKVIGWRAMPWASGGLYAIVLKDPRDTATTRQVRTLLARLAADSRNGIDRVLDAAALREQGGFPTATFVVGLKAGWHTGASLTGRVASSRSPGGTHGYLPDVPDMRASFFLVGPGVPAGRSLGTIDMRDIAPTLAARLGLTLPSADGKSLLP